MANTPQAKKRIRRNGRRADINTNRVSRIRTFVKKVELALAAGDAGAAARLTKRVAALA
jgi:small subunit ribosomal protein S20